MKKETNLGQKLSTELISYGITHAYNELHQFLDPYDPNLTQEQKEIIIDICDKDLLFCLEKLIKVFPGTNNSTEFIVNECNYLPLLHLACGDSILFRAPRESIKTSTILAFILVQTIFHNKSFKIYTRKLEDFNMLKAKLKLMYNMLPDYIKELKSEKEMSENIYNKNELVLVNYIWYEDINYITDKINLSDISVPLIITSVKPPKGQIAEELNRYYTTVKYDKIYLRDDILKILNKTIRNKYIFDMAFSYEDLGFEELEMYNRYQNLNKNLKSFLDETII